tara:strand:+ start:142 stop:1095 length:954 start_codon:yes stop_codon:yes gene_type:complete
MKISKSALIQIIAEETEKAVDVSGSEEKKTLTLPKIAISEDFGKPGSSSRKEIARYVSKIEGDTLESKIQNINNFITSCESGTCPSDPSSIIANLTVLNILASIASQYSASGGGFLMEAFIAALLEGKQIPVEGEEGVTDVQGSSGETYSIKFVNKFGHGGSFRNLKKTFQLNDGQPVTYYYVLKRGDKAEFYKMVLDEEMAERLWDKYGVTKDFDFFSEEFDSAAKGSSLGAFKIPKSMLEGPLTSVDMSPEYMLKLAEKFVDILKGDIAAMFDQLGKLTDNISVFVMEGNNDAGTEANKNLDGLRQAIAGQTAKR